MSTPPRDLMTEEIPRGAPDTVLQLRHSITDQQRGLLDSIWDAWASTRRPIPRRVLEQRPLGRTRVIELLESLGGSVVFRVGPSGNDPSGYCVTLLGALLTSGAIRWRLCSGNCCTTCVTASGRSPRYGS
jgi:hypothetical protein